jgi:Ca2+-binding RTX toxin-like protein
MSGTANDDSIQGTSERDFLFGSAGNDSIIGLEGDDYLDGGADNDSLLGGEGDDVLIGAGGNDTLLGGSGNDNIMAGAGNAILDGGAGSDSLGGWFGNYNMFGGAGNDLMTGSSGQDTFRGGSGADNFYLTGYDVFNPVGFGSPVMAPDRVLDFSRTEGDRLTLIGSTYGYPGPAVYYTPNYGPELPLGWMGALPSAVASLSLGLVLPGGQVQGYVPVYWISRLGGDGWVAMDLDLNGTLDATDFAIFVETPDDQPLTAADFPEDGFDFQFGTAGNDSILGVAAADLLNGLSGNDTIDGAGGDDVLWGGDGDDLLRGGQGNDTLSSIYRAANDTMLGGDGDDYISGYANNSIDGGAGNDTIEVNHGTATVVASTGDDWITFRHGNNRFTYIAGTGNDTLISWSGSDTLAISDGAWTLANDGLWTTYSQGSTSLYIRNFVRVIGASDESLLGDGGHNSLFGGNGNDTLSGLSGADTLDGGADNDSLVGGTGNDILDGGAGTNTLAGGAGDDTYYASGPVNLFEGSNAGNDILITNVSVTNLPSNIENILLQGSASLIGTGNLLNNQITGNTGNNSLYGGEGDDRLFGLAGTDYLDGGNGNDRLEGGEGDDTFLAGAGDDTLLGGSGRDRFDGNPGNNLINGGGGGDDYVSYSNGVQGTFGVSVNLVAGIASNTYGGIDTLIAIRGIQGSLQSDTLIGSDQLSGQVGLPGYPSSGTTFFASRGSDLINGTLSIAANGFYYNSLGSGGGTIIATFSDYLNATVIKSIGGADTLVNINYIFGSIGGDVLNGSPTAAPNDVYVQTKLLQGGAGNDTINGFGLTINRADYSSATSAISVDLAAGSAIDGQGGTDLLINVRRVRGSNFNDTILGSAGDDVIETRTLGSHRLDGGGGTNTYNFADTAGTSDTSAVLIDLGTTPADGGGYVGFIVKPTGITDTLIRFNQAGGADGNDTLYGTPGDDVLRGAAGDNLLDGRGGLNTLEYGTHWWGSVPTHGVVVNLDTGRATNPWDGIDTISNFQAVIGTPFADSITGSAAAETLTGGAGNDTLIGNGGADSLSGGAGDDVILVGTTTLADITALFSSWYR